MNILFLRSNPVDPDSRVEKEVASLVNAGHNVFIFGLDRSHDYKLKKEKKKIGNKYIDIYRVGHLSEYGAGKKNLVALIKFQKSIFKFIMKNKNEIDIIHACDLDTGFVTAFLKKIFKFKLIYDIFDYYPDSHGATGIIYRIIEKFENFTIKYSDKVIICSEERVEQIGLERTDKIEVIHNTPISFQNCMKYTVNNSDKTRIAYIGILGKTRMIEEMLKIVSEDKNFELHIGGFGSLEDTVKEYSKKYSNIIYYGKVSYEKTLEIESNCDVITAIYDPKIKNHFYAAPNKFYEALMLGKILIMVNETGMSNYVVEYQLGEKISYSAASLEKSLQQINNYSEEKKANISRIGKNLYKEKFSWSIMEKRLLKLYSEV